MVLDTSEELLFLGLSSRISWFSCHSMIESMILKILLDLVQRAARAALINISSTPKNVRTLHSKYGTPSSLARYRPTE